MSCYFDRCIPRTYYPNVDSGSESSQSVNEVITGGAEGMGSSTSVSTATSSSSSSTSVPEITVQEHESTQPVTTATSQASVTPIDTHKGTTPGNDITEEFTQPEGATDVITETFPARTASSQQAEVNETFKSLKPLCDLRDLETNRAETRVPLGMGANFCNNGMLCTMRTPDERETREFSPNWDIAWTKPFENVTGRIDLPVKGFSYFHADSSCVS